MAKARVTDLYTAHYHDEEQGTAIVGMFLFEAFRHRLRRLEKRERDLDPRYAFDLGGAIEQAEMLAVYAAGMVSEINQWMFRHPQEDWPGVLEYEVVETVGMWIAEWVVANKSWPSKKAVRKETKALTKRFFTRKWH